MERPQRINRAGARRRVPDILWSWYNSHSYQSNGSWIRMLLKNGNVRLRINIKALSHRKSVGQGDIYIGIISRIGIAFPPFFCGSPFTNLQAAVR